MQTDPILNGAPGFILLAFVVALAGYLRQVSVNAQDRKEQIESEKHPETWPKGEAHTVAKLNLLYNTKKNIEFLTFPLFGFIVIVAFRSVLYALTRLVVLHPVIDRVAGRFSNLWSNEWLSVIDLLLTTFLLMLVIAMSTMHGWGKLKDQEIANLRLKHTSRSSG